MSSPVPRHWPILTLLLTALLGATAPCVLANPGPPVEASLPAGIDEASGLARSLQHPALLWTHNDNINDPGSMRRVTPFLYGISPDGHRRLSLEVTGVIQRDWEAVECARVDGRGTLIVADSGDNRDSWPDYVLWFLTEPQTLPASGKARAAPQAVLRYRYPGGPADTEAMTVDPAGDRILLLSKRQEPPRLYTLPLADREPFSADDERSERERLREAGIHEARPLGPMGGIVPTDPINWLLSPLTGRQTSMPTDMALSPAGHLLAVLTYSSLYFYRRDGDQGWAEAIRRPVASRSLPRIEQWEGLAFSGDGRYVTIVREGSGPATMLRLEVPEAARATPVD